ncbi:hypothetical protein B0H10DRAFT_1954643 [Mycena sp. CBHHK59/15]|nr:hypothetical protein B0H10DRAFT_1954643 [Mycena sp. CBHHK59/15]
MEFLASNLAIYNSWVYPTCKQIFIPNSTGLSVENISGSGATYHGEEIKHLFRLLKSLPDTIPVGQAHDFANYTPNLQKVKDVGCTKIDAPDRASQDARTIVAQTKIYQHNRREARARDKSIQSQKQAKSPSLKWWSVEDLFPFPTGSEPLPTVATVGKNAEQPCIRGDLLAQKPIAGADAIRSLADWSGGVVVDVGGRENAAGNTLWDGETEKVVF